MRLVVGLGNPGSAYRNTPHSVGFEVVDLLADAAGVPWEEKRAFKSLLARVSLGGETVLLAKPQTFMNLSGEAVAPLLKYNNGKPSDLIVVHDDIDLALGRLRIRVGGSCGGHNGVRNVIERLGTDAFARVKLGVGKDKSNVTGHVLGAFPPSARPVADALVKAAAEAVRLLVGKGVDAAMNAFNSFDAASSQPCQT